MDRKNLWVDEIPFGNLRRPVRRNTLYDAAKFEVPAHEWMDVSYGGFGVSVLNDCKCGREANGKLIRLTLLMGSVYPDPSPIEATNVRLVERQNCHPKTILIFDRPVLDSWSCDLTENIEV